MRVPQRSALAVLLALCLGIVAGRGAETNGEDRVQDMKKLLSHQDQDPGSYLWLLDDSGVEKRGAKQLRKRLSESRVADLEAAYGIATRYKLDHGGLLAQESAGIAALRRLGRDVPRFGKTGDFVWVVRYVHLGGAAGQVIGGVTQELWISSTTAEVKAVLPPS